MFQEKYLLSIADLTDKPSEAVITKLRLVEKGDEFAFVDEPEIIYRAVAKGPEVLEAEHYKGFKGHSEPISLAHFGDRLVYRIFPEEKEKAAKKKKGNPDMLGPLKDQDDYPEFLKKFEARTHREASLILYAFDLWSTLKIVMDLISPFTFLFLKNPKLKQAYNLLVEVVREKTASSLAEALDLGTEDLETIESYLLEHRKSYKDLTAPEIDEIVSGN